MAFKWNRIADETIINLWKKGEGYRTIANRFTRNGLPISHQTIKNRLVTLGVIKQVKPSERPRYRTDITVLVAIARRLLVKN